MREREHMDSSAQGLHCCVIGSRAASLPATGSNAKLSILVAVGSAKMCKTVVRHTKLKYVSASRG